MQSTTCFHDDVANTVLQEAYLVFHNAISFYSTNCVFDTDADGRDCTIGRFFQGGEVTAPWFFLGLENRDPIASIPLEPHILIETTAVWEGIALQIGQVFVVCLPFIGGTQEANMTSLLDHEEVFDRMTLLLAAVVVLLVLGVGWAVDRSLSTIMPKRGDKGTLSVRLAASTIAKSSALRAGSSS
jgi:hypothetical protein